MKKYLLLFLIIILDVSNTLLVLYFFIFSKNIYIEEGIYFSGNIYKNDAKIILGKNSEMNGDKNLEKGEIILKEKSKLNCNIF